MNTRALPATLRIPNVWQAVTIALILFATAWFALSRVWSLSDIAAYDGAAQRLLHGEPLYPAVADQGAPDVYRYAPWFAVAWIPLLALPLEVRYAGWTGVLVVAGVLAAWPWLTSRRPLLVAVGVFAASWVAGAAKWGNVEPLMVCLLVWGVPRRWGPLAVGVAASLKVAPILLVLVWIGRGEWRKAGIALAVAVLLLAPMLLFDLSHYPLESAAAISVRRVFGVPVWLALVALLLAATWLLARTRWAWLLADLAVLAAYPQLPLYRLGQLLVGTDPLARHDLDVVVGVRGRRASGSRRA